MNLPVAQFVQAFMTNPYLDAGLQIVQSLSGFKFVSDTWHNCHRFRSPDMSIHSSKFDTSTCEPWIRCARWLWSQALRSRSCGAFRLRSPWENLWTVTPFLWLYTSIYNNYILWLYSNYIVTIRHCFSLKRGVAWCFCSLALAPLVTLQCGALRSNGTQTALALSHSRTSSKAGKEPGMVTAVWYFQHIAIDFSFDLREA